MRLVWQGSIALNIISATLGYAQCPSVENVGAAALTRVEKTANETVVYWDMKQNYPLTADYSPVLGQSFAVVRCLPPGKVVVVAHGLVASASGPLVEGRVQPVAEEPQARDMFLSQAQGANLYWRPMVGDFVVPKKALVAARARVSPRFTADVNELFVRDQRGISYFLSENGKRILERALERFRGLRGRLAVEGFARRFGQRDDLRQQTWMRAHEVARWMITQYGLEEGSVVAIGLGSDGLTPGMAPVARWPAKDIIEGVTIHLIPGP